MAALTSVIIAGGVVVAGEVILWLVGHPPGRELDSSHRRRHPLHHARRHPQAKPSDQRP